MCSVCINKHIFVCVCGCIYGTYIYELWDVYKMCTFKSRTKNTSDEKSMIQTSNNFAKNKIEIKITKVILSRNNDEINKLG